MDGKQQVVSKVHIIMHKAYYKLVSFKNMRTVTQFMSKALSKV